MEWIGTETYAALSATLVPTIHAVALFHTGHTRCADVLRHGQRDLIGRRHHARFGVRRVLMVRHMRARRGVRNGRFGKDCPSLSFLSFVLKNRLCRCKTQQSHSFWIYSILAPLLYIGNRKKRYFHNFLTEYGHAHLFVSFTACVARTK